MKLISEKLKSQILVVAALSLPVSVLATWSFSGGREITSYPVVIGSTNSSSGSRSLSVGWGNQITSSDAMVVGQYLNSPSAYSLVVGRYNQTSTGLRFVVGNGTSTTARSNAFEVYSDGRVVIPTPQGDIPMY